MLDPILWEITVCFSLKTFLNVTLLHKKEELRGIKTETEGYFP